jgi:Helix-turn-helix domain
MEVWGFAEIIARVIIAASTFPLDPVWRTIRRVELRALVDPCGGERRITALARLLLVAARLVAHDIVVGRVRRPERPRPVGAIHMYAARTAVSVEMRERISRVTTQRARRLLELIMEHGEVTTEELTEQYGYNHPPRAKRDAMDLGFQILSRRVPSKDGTRSISAYSLDFSVPEPDQMRTPGTQKVRPSRWIPSLLRP